MRWFALAGATAPAMVWTSRLLLASLSLFDRLVEQQQEDGGGHEGEAFTIRDSNEWLAAAALAASLVC